jgi:glycerol-3-phosphate acyltransferase PlsY
MELITSPAIWLMLAVGYGLGSVPFGLILTRMAGTEDLRSIGSGNIGATNVLRTGRKGLAAATLVLDALKGTAAVLIAQHVHGADAAAAAGLGAFLGHLYPVWLGFRGGKGVATYLGVIVALAPAAFLVFAACWLATAFLTRYSSLAALVGALASPLAMLAIGDLRIALFLSMLSLLVFWKHRPNISRLLAGTEGRIGQKG